MINTLMELCANMWRKPINEFGDTIYNASEIPTFNCDSFGSNNGQELLMYCGSQIICSCSTTTSFGQLVITHVYSKDGLVYKADVDRIYNEIKSNHSIVINYTIDELKEQIRTSLELAEDALANNDIIEASLRIGEVRAYHYSLDMVLISEGMNMSTDFDNQIITVDNRLNAMRSA